MQMTSFQETILNEFKEGLKKQISQYAIWGANELLSVVYFDFEEDIYLIATVPDGISNDDAGMYVRSHYFRISSDGELHNILKESYFDKKTYANEIIRINPNA
jgi:hypothetical protein